jgi:hypothetical protein
MNEQQLILQALTCTIARKKRKLKRSERLLMACSTDYEQMLGCKKIRQQIEIIKQFENLKMKYD